MAGGGGDPDAGGPSEVVGRHGVRAARTGPGRLSLGLAGRVHHVLLVKFGIGAAVSSVRHPWWVVGQGRRGGGRIGPAGRSDPGQHLVEVLQATDRLGPPGDRLAGLLGCGHVNHLSVRVAGWDWPAVTSVPDRAAGVCHPDDTTGMNPAEFAERFGVAPRPGSKLAVNCRSSGLDFQFRRVEDHDPATS